MVVLRRILTAKKWQPHLLNGLENGLAPNTGCATGGINRFRLMVDSIAVNTRRTLTHRGMARQGNLVDYLIPG